MDVFEYPPGPSAVFWRANEPAAPADGVHAKVTSGFTARDIVDLVAFLRDGRSGLEAEAGNRVTRTLEEPAMTVLSRTGILVTMWALAAIPSAPPLPPFAQAWMPNVVFLLVACALLLRGRRRGAVS